MVAYIDAYKDEFGVEPICEVLPIAPSTYYAAKSRPPSARAVRDAILMPLLLALWIANYRVYGARKLWKAAQREGHDAADAQLAHQPTSAGIRSPATTIVAAHQQGYTATEIAVLLDLA